MAEKKLEDLPPSYTNLGFDGEPIAGPSAPRVQEGGDLQEGLPGYASTPTAPLPEEPPGPPPLVYIPPSLVFEEIYEACRKYLKRRCCYGSRFINQMKLTSIVNKGVFHYTLESFGEKRESAYRTVPYKGGHVDGPENGRPPDPWDMTVTPPDLFKDCKIERSIPHTESVSTCYKCDGSGEVECYSCSGSGTESCSSCGGSGRDDEDNSCSRCSGSGSTSCWNCGGSGEITCSRCDGYGKVKDYKVLFVTWKNHPTDYITDTGKLPKKRIRKAEGTQMLYDRAPQLLPLTNAPEESVNLASARMLAAHEISFPNELIIRQKHVLRVVPFTRVAYKWKDEEGEFYVYDNDRKVYFEHYPQQCCCCTCC